MANSIGKISSQVSGGSIFNAITPALSDSELRFSLFHFWESRKQGAPSTLRDVMNSKKPRKQCIVRYQETLIYKDFNNLLNTVSTIDATVKLNCISKGFSSQDTQLERT
ncbi:hypothetical protein Bca4012_037277 [Brassica carinata]